MNAVETFDGGAANAAVAARRRALAATPDDKEMLRAAAELTRDIAVHRPAVYWADMLASAVLGYSALANLGYSQAQASAAVARVISREGDDAATEKLIRMGLRELSS